MTIEHFSTFSVMSAIGVVTGNGTLSPAYNFAVTDSTGHVTRFGPQLLQADVAAGLGPSNVPAPLWESGVFYPENFVVKYGTDGGRPPEPVRYIAAIDHTSEASTAPPGRFWLPALSVYVGQPVPIPNGAQVRVEQQFFATDPAHIVSAVIEPAGTTCELVTLVTRYGLKPFPCIDGVAQGGFDIDVDA